MHAIVLLPLFAGDSNSHSAHVRLGANTVIHGFILEVVSRSQDPTAPILSPPELRRIRIDSNRLTRVLSHQPPHPAPRAGTPGFSVLYGRYLGQIQARIERAWLRPRSAIGSDLFRCQVRIDQQRGGAVGDVTLQRCNGTVAWQESLVRAIDEASPLSAPPNPAVYTPDVVLVFRSMSYTPDAPSGEFAPPARPEVASEAANIKVFQRIRALRLETGAHSGKSVIDLRISGTQVQFIKIKK